MSAKFELNLSLFFVNTTPGRTITFKSTEGLAPAIARPKFFVSAMWKADSPVCAYAQKGYEKTVKPCAIMMGFGYADVPTPPSGTTELKAYKGSPGGQWTAGMAGVAEADWPAIEEALANPETFLVGYDGGDYRRFKCPQHPNLGVLVSASEPAYECGTVVPYIVKQPAP
ncbi:hypothetical protein [Paenarthrobacter aurescens]|uniref:hypothetical protein n=1 Tax=Paenarthrobacter aurescens TaxID=43663 RepID=UPI0021C10504|nr:hypothetical protein [Paenarthrobacter aurescens]MCT9868999.1 hypothetical protein [Paenarthrobacter aurescens]